MLDGLVGHRLPERDGTFLLVVIRAIILTLGSEPKRKRKQTQVEAILKQQQQ